MEVSVYVPWCIDREPADLDEVDEYYKKLYDKNEHKQCSLFFIEHMESIFLKKEFNFLLKLPKDLFILVITFLENFETQNLDFAIDKSNRQFFLDCLINLPKESLKKFYVVSYFDENNWVTQNYKWVLDRQIPILSFHLLKCRIHSKKLNKIIKKYFPLNLTLFSFVLGKKLKSCDLTQLSIKCNFLKFVDLHGCEKVDNKGIHQLARNCPNLTYLDLTDVRKITDESLKSLSIYNKKLETLILRNCFRLTDDGLAYLGNLKFLKKIDLYNRSKKKSKKNGIFFNISLITNIGLLNLINPNILQLILDFQINVSDDAIINLSGECSDIETLSLLSTLTSDIGFQYIATNCKKIKSLNLSSTNITDISANCFQKNNFQDLTILYLENTEISDIFIAELCKFCTNLRLLDLSNTFISNFSVVEIAKFLRSLEVIYFTGCDIDDDSIVPFAIISGEKNHCLTHIYLGDTQITLESIITLSNECENLESIYITYSNFDGFLSRLDIEMCDDILDKSIIKGYNDY